jgi:molybdopterin molybdotransferase
MISVAEAKKIIVQHTVELKPIKLSLAEAAGKLLAEDVYAVTDIPAFPQSSMDGYAFSFNDWQHTRKLIIAGEIAAGNNKHISLPTGRAIRIFTGAPVPNGADTVVMQEKVSIDDTAADARILSVIDDHIQQGANVRLSGSEIKKGECALEKNSHLSPSAVGFLAGIGIATVKVFPNPSISIIVTGKELQQPGNPLDHGQVYESNSFTLSAALEQWHMNDVKIFRADDDLKILTNTLSDALQQSDMVLLTGGISAGDYDFVLQAAEQCGVMKLFHKIKQRPGKPLYFGKREDKLVFGLPGNPSSVLTCFYEYVLPALSIVTKREMGLKAIQATLSKPFQKKVALTCFLKGLYDGKAVTILDAQESYKMRSFAKANCLVKIEEEAMDCETGASVEVHLLPI